MQADKVVQKNLKITNLCLHISVHAHTRLHFASCETSCRLQCVFLLLFSPSFLSLILLLSLQMVQTATI